MLVEELKKLREDSVIKHEHDTMDYINETLIPKLQCCAKSNYDRYDIFEFRLSTRVLTEWAASEGLTVRIAGLQVTLSGW